MARRSNQLHPRIVLVLVVVVCTLLIEHDFYPKWVQSRLIAAVESNDQHGVEAALERGADPNAITPAVVRDRGAQRHTLLTQTASQNSLGVVQALIRAGAKVNVPDPDGRRPLLSAILRRRTQIVSVLLDAGADPRQAGMGFDADHNPLRETPMEATHGLPLTMVFPSGAPRRAGVNRQRIYRLLREHGVVPTLNQAIDIGDTKEIKALIRAGADVDRGDDRYPPPLQIAISQGNRLLVGMLLQAGAKLNADDSKNGLPLVAALRAHDAKTVRLLVKHGAPVNFTTAAERYSLQAAILTDASPSEYRFLRSMGMTPDLSCAVRFNDMAGFKSLLKSGVDVNSALSKGNTPLLIGVEAGRKAMVHLLLTAGEDPNVGHPLIVACMRRNEEIARELLLAGADVNAPGEQVRVLMSGAEWVSRAQLQLATNGADGRLVTPLQLAAENNDVVMYSLLRRYHARSDLFLAAAIGDVQAVRSLIEQGADVNALNSLHDSPLTVALVRNRRPVVQYLLEHGANPSVFGSGGDCPLALAALHGEPRMVDTLLAHGARVNSVSKSGEPILMRLAYSDRVDIIRLLLAQGADVNTRGAAGQTVLMRAVRANKIATVQALLARGVDVNARSERGETALHLAVEQNAKELIAYLKRAGAEE